MLLAVRLASPVDPSEIIALDLTSPFSQATQGLEHEKHTGAPAFSMPHVSPGVRY